AKLTVKADGHYFRRADSGDALYNAGGAPFRPGGASSSKDVGSEIDLTAKYQFGPHLIGICGYSHFFAGDFIEGSGPDSDIDFGYLTLQYTF
ncbi:alginate export family protein, partial [bacterium]|nr:alginate export family protein [bacterium]